MRHVIHFRSLLSLCAVAPLASWAGPTTDAPATLEPATAVTAPMAAPGARAGTAAHSDARTIDMLVEMQQSTAGVQFNDKAPRASGGDPRSRSPSAAVVAPAQTPQLEKPPTSESGLFGTGATPTVQSRSATLNEPSARDGGQNRAAGRPSSEVPSELKRWLQGPREVIEYVRENRAVVIGCTALLLVLGWTGSVLFSRRRG